MTHEILKNMIKEEIDFNKQNPQMTKLDVLEIAHRWLSTIDDPKLNNQLKDYINKKEIIINDIQFHTKKLEQLVDEHLSAIETGL